MPFPGYQNPKFTFGAPQSDASGRLAAARQALIGFLARNGVAGSNLMRGMMAFGARSVPRDVFPFDYRTLAGQIQLHGNPYSPWARQNDPQTERRLAEAAQWSPATVDPAYSNALPYVGVTAGGSGTMDPTQVAGYAPSQTAAMPPSGYVPGPGYMGGPNAYGGYGGTYPPPPSGPAPVNSPAAVNPAAARMAAQWRRWYNVRH